MRRFGHGRLAGFTIIEVMVAMLIFAVAIVSIFGAQFSAISTTELARCRMSELELEFLQNGGFEEGDVTQSGPCCEALDGDENAADYTCSWEIKTIVLPDVTQMMSGTDGGLGGGMFGDLLGGSTGDLTGDSTGDSTGDAMGEMGMDMVSAFLPTVTDMLEQAIRRVTVTVEWELASGAKRDLSVVQFVVHPTQGPLQLLQQASATDQMADQLGLGEGDQQTAAPAGGKTQGGR
jgi:prepilin-type N-terminal cleavage/methylation domain-containing protein